MALIHVDFFSEVLGMSSQMKVILPQETTGQIGIDKVEKRKTWPVLYLLHGMTDDHSTWSRNTSIERYAAERGIAVVMPNCHLGWYTDMKVGFPYFTYIAKEVPAVCRRFFPCISQKREDTFVAGNSMGGYGAFKLALSCPEDFSAAVSLSGGLDASTCAKRNGDAFYPTLWEDIFGEQEKIRGSANDLFALSEALEKERRPRLYMWCGTEDFLYDQNLAMKQHLESLHYDLTYKDGPGNHAWNYWDLQIQDSLDWLLSKEKEEI